MGRGARGGRRSAFFCTPRPTCVAMWTPRACSTGVSRCAALALSGSEYSALYSLSSAPGYISLYSENGTKVLCWTPHHSFYEPLAMLSIHPPGSTGQSPEGLLPSAEAQNKSGAVTNIYTYWTGTRASGLINVTTVSPLQPQPPPPTCLYGGPHHTAIAATASPQILPPGYPREACGCQPAI